MLKGPSFSRNTSETGFLIADSKGNYLKAHADKIEQFGYHINFQCRSGASFADYYYWLWGWSGGAKVLGKLPVPGRPTDLDYSRARA